MNYKYSGSPRLAIVVMTIFATIIISFWFSTLIANLPPLGVQMVQGG